MPDLVEETDVDHLVEPDTPWKTILWNDDVNTVGYVVLTLQKILKKDKETCEKYMLEAHTNGRTAVFSGSKEEAQDIATQLGAATLWATVEKE